MGEFAHPKDSKMSNNKNSGIALFLVITLAVIISILALGVMVYIYGQRIIITKREDSSLAFYYASEFANEGVWIIRDGIRVGGGLDIIPHDTPPREDTSYSRNHSIENGSGWLEMRRISAVQPYWRITAYCEINPRLPGRRVSARRIEVKIWEDTGKIKRWREIIPPGEILERP